MFTLVYPKTNPLQTLHGMQFDLSQAQTNDWLHRLLPVVQSPLSEVGLLPERDGKAVATGKLAQEGSPNLALDGTERRCERPKDQPAQKRADSGKKKSHTVKNVPVVNETTGKIVYLGPTEPGAKHDKTAAAEVDLAYPVNAMVDKDSDPEAILVAWRWRRFLHTSLRNRGIEW